MNNVNNQKTKSDRLVKMAMMAAVACVLGLVRFPLIPAVSFLTYDLADIPIIITTFAFLMTAGLIYRNHKTKKVAILSMAVATLLMTVVMGFANYFVTPFYYGGEAMREMVVSLMPLILLFNVIKGVLNSGITFVIYKRISGFLHREGLHKAYGNKENSTN